MRPPLALQWKKVGAKWILVCCRAMSFVARLLNINTDTTNRWFNHKVRMKDQDETSSRTNNQ
jgi:hypothetical protein